MDLYFIPRSGSNVDTPSVETTSEVNDNTTGANTNTPSIDTSNKTNNNISNNNITRTLLDNTLSIPTTDIFNNLIYYINKFIGYYRVCVPNNIIKKILEVIYSNGYPGYKRYYNSISRI